MSFYSLLDQDGKCTVESQAQECLHEESWGKVTVTAAESASIVITRGHVSEQPYARY